MGNCSLYVVLEQSSGVCLESESDLFTMETFSHQQWRVMIGSFFCEHWRHSLFNLFGHMELPKLTTYRVISRWEQDIPMTLRPGQGCKHVKMTRRSHLVKTALLKVGVSTRKLACHFHISESYSCNILKQEHVHFMRQRKSPKYSEDQLARAKRACGILRCHFFWPSEATAIVMDDEAYFGLKNNKILGNKGFYKKKDMEAGDVPLEVRLRPTEKFPQKLLVWIAISPNAISEPFFCQSKQAMKGEIYRKHCIKDCLVPFLNENRADGSYYFWPDLAGAHYTKKTVNLFEEENIAYISKSCNPPNCPQFCPIEDFWAHLAFKVYDSGWEAHSFRQLKQRIRQKFQEVDIEQCQRLFQTVKTKLCKGADLDVQAVNN